MDKPWVKYVLIALAIVGGFLVRWFFEPAPKETTQLQQTILEVRHSADSTVYVVKIDSLTRIVDKLNDRLNYSNAKLVELKQQALKKQQYIKLLPAEETVSYFNCSTGDSAKVIVVEQDTMALATIPGVKAANLLFIDRSSCFEIQSQLDLKINDMDEMITTKDELLSVKDLYIKNLNDQYFASSSIIKDQNLLIGKQQKKIRTKNVILGLLGGIAAASIIIIAVK